MVHAKPGSRTEGVEVRSDGVWVVKVRAPAVDGRANDRLVEVLAAHLRCRPSSIRVISGQTSRRKLVEISEHAFRTVIR